MDGLRRYFEGSFGASPGAVIAVSAAVAVMLVALAVMLARNRRPPVGALPYLHVLGLAFIGLLVIASFTRWEAYTVLTWCFVAVFWASAFFGVYSALCGEPVRPTREAEVPGLPSSGNDANDGQ